MRRILLRNRPKDPGPYVLARNELGLYCLPRKALHRPACQQVLSGKVWEADTIRLLAAHGPGDVIHGGTFFGDALPALSRAFRRVWAFEPNPDSFKCASMTVALNDLPNITLTNAGMGDTKTTAKLQTERGGQYLGGGSFISDEGEPVSIVTIDETVPKNSDIRLIHLDVERFEQQALLGARETIARCKPAIVVETVPPILSELGYRLKRSLEDNHLFVAG